MNNSPSSSSPTNKRVLKDKVIDQLLQLEDLFHSRFLTAELLNELIATYVQAIECFDGQHAALRKYFLNKIQFVLSRPEIDGMLERANQEAKKESGGDMVNALRETIRMTGFNSHKTGMGEGEDVFSEKMILETIESENKKQRQQQFKKSNVSATNSEVSEDVKLHDRKAKIEMQMKVMRQIEENMKSLKQQVKDNDQKKQQKSKRINALMNEQNEDLENRRAMRRMMKNKKKKKNSVDEKEIKEIQEEEPVIKKEELREAQKEIAEAVIRMTARITERNKLNSGTGLLAGGSGKNAGRVKIQESRDENQDQEEERDFFAEKERPVKQVELKGGNGMMKKKSGVSQQGLAIKPSDDKKSKVSITAEKDATEDKNQESKGSSTPATQTEDPDRQTGNKGRVTMKKEEEDEEDLMNDDCF